MPLGWSMDELKDEQVKELKHTLQEYLALLTEARALGSIRGGNNTANFNITAGGLFSVAVLFLCGICCAVMVTLYVVDRQDKREAEHQAQLQLLQVHQDLKDLRDNQTTLQAYVNQLYRDKAKP